MGVRGVWTLFRHLFKGIDPLVLDEKEKLKISSILRNAMLKSRDTEPSPFFKQSLPFNLSTKLVSLFM